MAGHRWGKKGRWSQWYHLHLGCDNPSAARSLHLLWHPALPSADTRVAWDGVNHRFDLHPPHLASWQAFSKQRIGLAQKARPLGAGGHNALPRIWIGLSVPSNTPRPDQAEGFEPVAVKANPSPLFFTLRRVRTRCRRQPHGHKLQPLMREPTIVRHSPPEAPSSHRKRRRSTFFGSRRLYSVHLDDQHSTPWSMR